MDWIASPDIWIALITLTTLEIVLGVDNILFIAILASRLPVDQQAKGRNVGLILAMITRIALLFSITLIMKLTEPFITILQRGFSGRDLILIAGGLFLLGKSTLEIHESLEGEDYDNKDPATAGKSFFGVLVQIMLLDIVFSLDSVITAVGLSDHLGIMVTAILISVGVMIFLAKSIADFVKSHPTIKILALSFLMLIGLSLTGEGLHFHIPKGYIYFAMAFSVMVEILNMKLRRKTAPIRLRQSPVGKIPQ